MNKPFVPDECVQAVKAAPTDEEKAIAAIQAYGAWLASRAPVKPAFNPHLPARTRDGRRVEIIKVLDRPTEGGKTIAAIVYDKHTGTPEIADYGHDGKFNPPRETGWDLVNVAVPLFTPEQIAAKRWLGIA